MLLKILIIALILKIILSTILYVMEEKEKRNSNSSNIPSVPSYSPPPMPPCDSLKELDVAELTRQAIDDKMSSYIQTINEKIVATARKGDSKIRFTETREEFAEYIEDYYYDKDYNVTLSSVCGTNVIEIDWSEWIEDAQINDTVKQVEASELDKYYDDYND